MTPERLTYFYNKYCRILGTRAISILSNCDSIPWGTHRDVVADAFVALIKFEDTGENDIPVDIFLKTKVKNDCLNLIKHYSRRNRHHDAILYTSDEYEEAVEVKVGLLEAIIEQINKLPVVQRMVFKMRYIDDMKPREICAKLKMAPGTFDTHMMRAKQRIRSVFKDREV